MTRTGRSTCKETRAADLLCAARDIFAAKGFAATRLDDVAAKAGVSKGTVYLYFESKEALFRAVIESGLTCLTEALEAMDRLAEDAGRPAIEVLRDYFGVWKTVLRQIAVGGSLRLLNAESGNFPDAVERFNHAIVRRMKSAMARIIGAGIASGDFRRVAPGTIADLFFAAVSLWAIDNLGRRGQSVETLLDGLFDLLTRGLVGLRAGE